jgi:hypothetical protein
MNTALQTQSTLTRLPVLKLEDDRIIIGALLKYIDNRTPAWARHDGVPLRSGALYLGLGVRSALQRFVDRVPEVITAKPGEKLPDVDELNRQIPIEEWPVGLTGTAEPPWKREFIVHMIDIVDLTILTYSNHTIGAVRCVKDLEDRWEWARALYGAEVMPLFTLSEAPFPTAYGERKRPVFTIVGWRQFTGGALRVVDQSAAALDTVKPKSLSADLKDNLPF